MRNLWTSVAAFDLNLWARTLVECWAWHKRAEDIRDRSDSPWDAPERRPSHADRRQALRRPTLQNESALRRNLCENRGKAPGRLDTLEPFKC